MGFGATEAIIVLGIAVLLFGGKKLPELGGALGKSLSNFKKGIKGVSADDKDAIESPKGE